MSSDHFYDNNRTGNGFRFLLCMTGIIIIIIYTKMI